MSFAPAPLEPTPSKKVQRALPRILDLSAYRFSGCSCLREVVSQYAQGIEERLKEDPEWL